MTSPPSPPLPPSGPPIAMYFSRRNEQAPLPPGPASTWMVASSTNCMERLAAAPRLTSGFGSDHADDTALEAAFLLEFHLTISGREQRVVASTADVVAGMKLSAALTHDDVACEYCLTAELLQTQPLRMRIATVAGTTACFFVCHERDS